MTYHNGDWTSSAPAPGGPVAPTVGPPLTAQDRIQLEADDASARAAADALQTYNRVEPSISRFPSGPVRGTIIGAAVPPDNAGFLGQIGAAVTSPLRATGIISNQNVNDLQAIRVAQSRAVQVLQRAQRGTQTEGDRAFYKLSSISGTNTPHTNHDLIAQGREDARRAIAHAQYRTVWAHTYGLHQPDQHGRSVEAAFLQDYRPAASNAPSPPGIAPAGLPPGYALVERNVGGGASVPATAAVRRGLNTLGGSVR